MRIYANFSEEEYNLIMNESEILGFSPSAYVKYMSLLGTGNKNVDNDLKLLMQDMELSLKNLKSGKTFIISALLPNRWFKLTRNLKMTLSKALAKIVKENPDLYAIEGKIPGKINLYRKLFL